MPIAAAVDDISTLPEDQQGLYRKTESGNFILDVEPTNGFSLENVDGLKSALGKERGRANDFETKLKGYGDLDPDSVRNSLSELATLQNTDINGEAQKLADSMSQKKIDQIVGKHTEELDAEKSRSTLLQGSLESIMVDNQAQQAIIKAGGNESTVVMLMPHVKAAAKLRQNGQNYFVDVIDKEGNPRVGDSSGSAMSLSQLVEEMKASDTFSGAFPSTGKSGGGMQSNGKPSGQNGKAKRSEMTSKEKAELVAQIGFDEFAKIPY